MKLVSFLVGDRSSFGILRGDAVVDLKTRLGNRYPTLRSTLANWQSLARFADEPADYRLDELTLHIPVTDPGRIICVGLNYRTHIAESGHKIPEYPMLFPRYADSLVASGAAMIRPLASDRFDYEGELAFVIGAAGRHIPAERALDHVAGYACFNDGSLRDFQRHTTQFLPGKNFAGSGAFGPWLVTPDEAGEIGQLNLVTRLNRIEKQRTRLDDLLFGVSDLIVYLSTIFALQPGDVIATGTTGGVGLYHEPPLWMKPGDTVEVEIDRLGTLRNPIEDEPAA